MNRRRSYIVTALGVLLALFWLWPKPVQTPLALTPEVVGKPIPSPQARLSRVNQVLPKPEAASPQRQPSSLKPSAKLELIQDIKSQMQAGLMSIYTSEKAFFAEYGRYSTDLQALGWAPYVTPMRVKMGFINMYYPSEFAEGEKMRFRDSDDFVGMESGEGDEVYRFAPSARDISLRSLEAHCASGCTASESTFEVIGAANLDEDPTLDVWTIDHRRRLIHLVDDQAN